MNISRCRP